MTALCSGYLQVWLLHVWPWKWELQRVSVQPLMKTNKWRRNTLTKPNRNTLINYATGCKSLCPFKSHTAVVCPFMQLRGVWVGSGGGGGGGGVKGLLRLRPVPIYLSSSRFMANSLVKPSHSFSSVSDARIVCHKITLCPPKHGHMWTAGRRRTWHWCAIRSEEVCFFLLNSDLIVRPVCRRLRLMLCLN